MSFDEIDDFVDATSALFAYPEASHQCRGRPTRSLRATHIAREPDRGGILVREVPYSSYVNALDNARGRGLGRWSASYSQGNSSRSSANILAKGPQPRASGLLMFIIV